MKSNERGSVSLIVTVTVMFILIILSASLMFVSTKRKAQLQESQILQNVYGGDLYETYTERSQKLSYNNCISNNLLVYYDAINNTGSGHSNTVTTWKNLAGDATFDGKLNNGPTFYNNYLSFDGVDDWVAIGNLSGKKSYTLDFTVMLLDNKSCNVYSNVESGGLCLETSSDYFQLAVFTSGSYKYIKSKEIQAINKITHYVGTYDGNHTKLYINGMLNAEADIAGQFVDPLDNTIFVLGGNPSGNSLSDITKKMNVYSCRLYDRALSDAEVKHNFEVDRARYMIEE